MNAVPSGPPESDNSRASGPGGGGPPQDGGTERRCAALEVRFDTILPTLATKADLGELRLDMEKMRSGLLEKIDALSTALRAEMKQLNNEVHDSLMKAMMWFGALTFTAIVAVGGAFYHLNTQISSLSARLPPASSVAPARGQPAAWSDQPASHPSSQSRATGPDWTAR